jgi:hypothetical protein
MKKLLKEFIELTVFILLGSAFWVFALIKWTEEVMMFYD